MKLTKKLFRSLPIFLVEYRKVFEEFVFWCPSCHFHHYYDVRGSSLKDQNRDSEISENDIYYFEATLCKRTSLFKKDGYILRVEKITEDVV